MLELQNEHFVRDCLKFSHFVASKSTCSHEFCHEPQNLLPQNRCFLRGFRQFSSHVTKCHSCTEFARCHHFAQPWHCDSQKKHARQHVWTATPATQNDDGVLQSAVPAPEKCTSSSENDAKVLRHVTQNDFRHVMKHVGMSQSATPATWNEATRRLKFPKVNIFAELAIGTATATSSSRTVADGCGRLPTAAGGCGGLRSQKRRRANTSPPPDPQSKTRTLRYAFGKKRERQTERR